MKKIKQAGKYDCLLACLSSLKETEIHELFPEEFRDEIELEKATQGKNINLAFEFAGFIAGVNYKTFPIPHIMQGYGHVIFDMLWGRKAIIVVPSLNYEGGYHCIVWDGREIHDPSNFLIYQYPQSIMPCQIFVIGDDQ